MGGRRKSRLIADVLAEIIQQPGETDEEYARRRNRERRRAYRALIPKGPKRLRGPDKQLRKNAAPDWVRAGLVALPGESEEDRKRRYHRLVLQNWRQNNHEKYLAKRREKDSTPEYKATKARWHARNPHKKAEYWRRSFSKNKDEQISKLKAWGEKNPEKIKAARKRWFAQRPGYTAAYLTRYREAAVRATPPWMWSIFGKEMDRIYAQCARISKKTGIPHHVDHIYPLMGKNSCGLHVPWNLQIIPATLNGKKHNKDPEEFAESLLSLPT